jgi:hypothetical protein
MIVFIQAQAVNRLFHALLPCPAVQRFYLRLNRIKIISRVMPLIFFTQILRFFYAFGHRFKHGGIALKQRLLRHVSDAQIALQLQQAVVGFLNARENFEERRFTRAVAANQADAFVCFQREARAVEQRDMTISEVSV